MRGIDPPPGSASHAPRTPLADAALPSLLLALLRDCPTALVVAAAPDGTIVAATELTAELLGRPVADLIGQAAEAHPARLGLRRSGERDLPAPDVLPLARALRTGEAIRDEVWDLCHGDGSTRRISCSAGPIRDESGTIRWAVLVWRDVTAEQAALQARDRLLALKDTMMRIAGHRVRSSLSLVAALVRMHAGSAPLPARTQLLSAAARTVAVGQIHYDVLRDGDSSRVEIGRYLARIGRGLETAVAEADRPVTVTVDAPPASLSHELATCLGLLTIELVTAGRAMAGRQEGAREIEIGLRIGAEGGALSVVDRGAALPTDFAPDTAAGPGLRLVRSLAAQLDGKLEVEPLAEGARFRVAFPLPAHPHGKACLETFQAS